jgi:DNA-binding ferritin-like protein
VTSAAAIGYELLVPGKAEPVSVHQSLDEWQDAYEDMAEKVAKAGKRPARERMTILRELKEANERTIERVDMVKRIRHAANYTKRIKALGAAQG